MPSISLGNQQLSYRELGEGRPALLLLHAAGCGSAGFTELVARLGQSCRTVALDLPGHGHSPAPVPLPLPSELLERYRDLVAEAAVKLALGRPVVVGHSMGGAVAQLLALDLPDRVDGLVLLATSARLKVAPTVIAAIRDSFDRLPELLSQVGYSPSTPRERAAALARQQGAAPQEVTLLDFRACDLFDVRARLASLTHRTVVVSASDDLITPPKLQQRLAEALPRARLVPLARCGHFLHAERADAVAEAILEARAWIAQDPGPVDRVRPPVVA